MISQLDTANNPARILIVDDDYQNGELLKAMLAPEGFVLLTAVSGEDALAMIAQQSPDLILLDVAMPGLDGYQVAAKLKADLATKNIPIIMVTVHDDHESRILGLTAGAEDFLSKPVNRAELCVRVRNLLRLKAYGDYYGKYSETLAGEVAARTADLVERTKLLEEQTVVLIEQAALLHLAQDAIIVRDACGRILFWNRGAEAMYGWLDKEALGKNAVELLKSEFCGSTEQIQATLLRESRWEGEAIHHRKDGTSLAVASRWALQSDSVGAPVRILSIDTDISERKQTDSERLMLTERLSLATAVAKVGVWEWDLAPNTLSWDATMFDIHGFPPVVPMPYDRWSAAVHPEDLQRVDAALQRIIKEKIPGSAEHRIILADGSVRNISAVARVVLGKQGNVTRVIGVNMDITERKQVEGEIIRARNLAQETARVKSEFLANMNHELRTPMNGVIGLTEMVLETDLTDEQREWLKIVKRSTHSLMGLIDNALTFSDYDAVKREIVEFDIEKSLQETIDVFSEAVNKKGLTLACQISPDVPRKLNGEPKRLQKALRLLIDNAIKFTNCGEITVSIEQESHTNNEICLHFTVRDTGIGIALDKQEIIFSPFTQVDGSLTRKYSGTGLGLTVCRRLVEILGGSIWVSSKLDGGSAFHFTGQFALSKPK